ncbi:MAG TPA: threonine/serine dehydratase [Candidatus Limnocylindrales bacterium]|nr:threonine/serine dehydratase [Candidatus Limnocylindrales bacterium]
MRQSLYRPTLQDVLQAKKIIARYLLRTPLHYYASLSQLLGAEVYVKHENHQPIGAFKIRGGIYLLSQLSPEERSRGVITASSGNHGQSIAYASKLFGVRAIIVCPENANPDKMEAIKNMGAELLFHGREFDDSRIYAEQIAQEKGYRYIHAGDEPLLIAGVGTIHLEILEDLPNAEVIITPIGGGSGAAGACTVVKAINPAIRVIGVQAEQAPAVYLSWKEGREVIRPSMTSFEGLATRSPFKLPLGILRDFLDDFLVVSEEEIERAILILLEKTHNLVEGAGASPLAAALKIRESLVGKKVVLVMSGGNITLSGLRNLLIKHLK